MAPTNPFAPPRTLSRSALQVCFRKRRQGLFRKADEIITICRGQVAAIAFSPAGKPFGFGSVGEVVGTYRHWIRRTSAPPIEEEAPTDSDLWWRQSIDRLELEELKELKEVLKEHRRMLLEESAAVPRGGVGLSALVEAAALELELLQR